jgi:hypothetical protein
MAKPPSLKRPRQSPGGARHAIDGDLQGALAACDQALLHREQLAMPFELGPLPSSNAWVATVGGQDTPRAARDRSARSVGRAHGDRASCRRVS